MIKLLPYILFEKIYINILALCQLYRRTFVPYGVVVSGVRRMNEVNPRRARLVHGWVTVFRRVYHLDM